MKNHPVVVIGSSNLDLVVEVPRIPAPGETVQGGPVSFVSGGKGANQAVAALRAGASVSFVSAVGDDEFGKRLLTSHKEAGLDTCHEVVVEGSPTGTALIVVDVNAENTITVSAGANGFLDPVTVESALATLLSPGTVLMMQLEIPLPTVLAAARFARAVGATVLLNASPLGSEDGDLLREILQLTDVLVVNQTEAQYVSPESESMEATLRGLSSLGPRIVIETLGKDGALVLQGNRVSEAQAFPVDAVDTTGAGDSFAGALACALASGESLETAVRFASAAGALATTAIGAQSSVPTKEAIERFLSQR